MTLQFFGGHPVFWYPLQHVASKIDKVILLLVYHFGDHVTQCFAF